jgi:putative polyhydroxyalkanoate system protein
MANIRVQRTHHLSLADIRAKAGDLAEQLSRKFGGEHHWQGDNLNYQRSGVDACIACTVEDIVVDIKLKGLMMSALRGTIEAEVSSTLDKYLA